MLRAFAAALLIGTASAGEKIVTIGDSLTFAYEAEFGPPFADGFGTNAKNWIEILNGNLSGFGLRSQWFDLGVRDSYSFLFTNYLFRHQFNWAIPGSKADELRRFVTGESTFIDLVSGDPTFDFLLLLTGLNNSDFDVADLQVQITSQASRFVYFCGGNDVRGVYGPVYNGTYNGGDWQPFVDDFVADVTATIDKFDEWNPTLPGVIVAVPHIGITPDIRGTYPTDPVATGRVTTMLRELNRQLKELAESRGLGFADIFEPTLRLLDGSKPLCVHGITYINDGWSPQSNGWSSTKANYVWLNGSLSANFHPGTNAQAMIADIIIRAFNSKYGSEIPPLTATEILGTLLGKTAGTIDMTFASWMTGYGLTGLPETDDSDGDGIPAGVEFAIGLEPDFRDAFKVLQSNDGANIQLAYTLRLPTTTKVTVSAQTSDDLGGFTNLVPQPTVGASGYAKALLPIAGDAGFLRLNATVAP